MRVTKVGLVVVAVMVLGGCKTAETNMAGEQYKKLLLEAKDVLESFAVRYPEVDDTLDGHRSADRARVVSAIERDMIPLIENTVATMARAIEAGHRYTALLDDEVAAKKTIVSQLGRMESQLEGFKKIRATYVKEAALFAKPDHDDADFQTILEARMAAGRFIAGQAD